MKNKKETPLYGMIAYPGGNFTLLYRKHGNQSSINKEGYNISVFDECPDDMSVVRFDKASFKNIVSWLDKNYNCSDYFYSAKVFRSLNLQDFLAMFANYSIPVEELHTTRESFNRGKNDTV